MENSSSYLGQINTTKCELTDESTVIDELVADLKKDIDVPVAEESGSDSGETETPANEEVPVTAVISPYLLDGKHDKELKEMGVLRDGKNYYFDLDHDGIVDDNERKSYLTRESDKKIRLHTEGEKSFTVNSLTIYGDISKCEKTLILTRCDIGKQSQRAGEYNDTANKNMIVMEVDAKDSVGAYKELTKTTTKPMDTFLSNLGDKNTISHGIGGFSQSATALLQYITSGDTIYEDVYFAYAPNTAGKNIDWSKLSKYNIHICESEADISLKQHNNSVDDLYLGQGTLKKIFQNANSVSITVPGKYASDPKSDSYALLEAGRKYAEKYGKTYDEHIAEGASWKGHDAAKSAMRYGSAW